MARLPIRACGIFEIAEQSAGEYEAEIGGSPRRTFRVDWLA
jgi:hypothetical protein